MRNADDLLALVGQMEKRDLVDETLRCCPLGRALRLTGRTQAS